MSRRPRTTANEKIDFTDRMGRAFAARSPELDARYFKNPLEETAVIGDPADLKREEMVENRMSRKQPAPE